MQTRNIGVKDAFNRKIIWQKKTPNLAFDNFSVVMSQEGELELWAGLNIKEVIMKNELKILFTTVFGKTLWSLKGGGKLYEITPGVFTFYKFDWDGQGRMFYRKTSVTAERYLYDPPELFLTPIETRLIRRSLKKRKEEEYA
jgi:hypothetical protein